jgi:hypothetical protein
MALAGLMPLMMSRGTEFLGLVGLLTVVVVTSYILSTMADDNANKSADNFGCALMLFVPILLYIALRNIFY